MEKVRSGKFYKEQIMNNYIKYLYGIIICCLCMFVSSCSQEDAASFQSQLRFEDLRFVVEVKSTSSDDHLTTRAASDKADWVIGDEILIAIDGKDNNLFKLEYKGNGAWRVSKVSDQTAFSMDKGTLSAVHADNLGFDGAEIITNGDILYTQEGSYAIEGDVVYITLDMNRRPLSRIAVVGMDHSGRIEGFEDFGRLKSPSSMQWNVMKSSVGKLSDEIYGDTCVFYGNLQPNDLGGTTIRIVSNNGVSYERTYAQRMKAGDYIIIQGPLSKESSLWTKHALVHSVLLEKRVLNLVAGDNYLNRAELYNKDADNQKLVWSSTDSNVATVDQNGNVTAVANGDAKIVVKSEDGSARTTCDVHVGNFEEFVSIGYNLISTKVDGSTTTLTFALPVTNNYSKPIRLSNSAGFSSNSADVLTSVSKFTASFGSQIINSNETADVEVNLIFAGNFSFSWTSDGSKQNWVTIGCSIDGSSTEYKLKTYLPWTLSK